MQLFIYAHNINSNIYILNYELCHILCSVSVCQRVVSSGEKLSIGSVYILVGGTYYIPVLYRCYMRGWLMLECWMLECWGW